MQTLKKIVLLILSFLVHVSCYGMEKDTAKHPTTTLYASSRQSSSTSGPHSTQSFQIPQSSTEARASINITARTTSINAPPSTAPCRFDGKPLPQNQQLAGQYCCRLRDEVFSIGRQDFRISSQPLLLDRLKDYITLYHNLDPEVDLRSFTNQLLSDLAQCSKIPHSILRNIGENHLAPLITELSKPQQTKMCAPNTYFAQDTEQRQSTTTNLTQSIKTNTPQACNLLETLVSQYHSSRPTPSIHSSQQLDFVQSQPFKEQIASCLQSNFFDNLMPNEFVEVQSTEQNTRSFIALRTKENRSQVGAIKLTVQNELPEYGPIIEITVCDTETYEIPPEKTEAIKAPPHTSTSAVGQTHRPTSSTYTVCPTRGTFTTNPVRLILQPSTIPTSADSTSDTQQEANTVTTVSTTPETTSNFFDRAFNTITDTTSFLFQQTCSLARAAGEGAANAIVAISNKTAEFFTAAGRSAIDSTIAIAETTGTIASEVAAETAVHATANVIGSVVAHAISGPQNIRPIPQSPLHQAVSPALHYTRTPLHQAQSPLYNAVSPIHSTDSTMHYQRQAAISVLQHAKRQRNEHVSDLSQTRPQKPPCLETRSRDLTPSTESAQYQQTNVIIQQFQSSNNTIRALIQQFPNSNHINAIARSIDECSALAQTEPNLAKVAQYSDFCSAETEVLTKALPILYNATKASVKGFAKGIRTVLSPHHWQEMATNAFNISLLFLDAAGCEELRTDNAFATLFSHDETMHHHAAATYCAQTQTQRSIVIGATQQTLHRLRSMSWQEIIENGVELGTTMVLDTLAFNALNAFTTPYIKASLEQIKKSLANPKLFAEQHAIEIAGFGKILAEEGPASASKVADLITNNPEIFEGSSFCTTPSPWASERIPAGAIYKELAGIAPEVMPRQNLKHYFLGEIVRTKKGLRLQGFHHARNYPERIKEILIPPNESGVYKAIYQHNGLEKMSTFFPNRWNRITMLKKISEAYKNPIEFTECGVIGKTTEGMKVQIWFLKNEKTNYELIINSAYPILE